MIRSFPLLNQNILHLQSNEAAAIATFLRENSFSPYEGEDNFEHFLSRAVLLSKLLPDEIFARILTFRSQGNQDGVLVIRGLPVDDQGIGPTPADWALSLQRDHLYETEMYLLGVTALLGEVFSFASQHTGNLIQNLVPMEAHVFEQLGTGSQTFLEWHIEDAFHLFRPDFVGLLCLRSDPLAATTFASVRNMQLPEWCKQRLFKADFQVAIDKAHGGTSTVEEGPRVSVLWGNYDDPCIRLDRDCIKAAPDALAEAALDLIVEESARVARQIVLQPGDLLLLDNHRVVHGRTPFTPKFDGTDRWLQRVIITSDLRKSALCRGNHSRVIESVREYVG